MNKKHQKQVLLVLVCNSPELISRLIRLNNK